jgi:hypothetical protein
LSAPKAAGLNRVYWDLRDDPTTEVKLRTSPRFAPEIRVGPDGTRPGPGRMSILMPPGSYTVRLDVDGKQLSQKLEVRRDPNAGGSDAEITEQMKTLRELRRSMDTASNVVNQIELVRGQILGLSQVLERSEIMKVGMEIEQKLADLEQNFVELRSTGRGQDGVRWGAKLLGKFGYLANGLAGTDFKPTNQQLEVQKVLDEQLKKHQAALEALLKTEVTFFNERLRSSGIPNIVIAKPGSSQ